MCDFSAKCLLLLKRLKHVETKYAVKMWQWYGYFNIEDPPKAMQYGKSMIASSTHKCAKETMANSC